MPEPRPFGKLGCLPGKIPVGLRDITYYVAGDLPKAPPSVKMPAVANWEMLGNDRYGDCGVAGLEHGFMADANIVKARETFANADQTIAYYLKYTNGQDAGVVLADYLNYVRSHGFYKNKVSAYAPVSTNDVPTLQTAIFMYGFAYTGIAVTHEMQVAFQEHKPWTSDVCSGPIIGGHCVPLVGYDDQYLYLVTWGGIQAISYSAWHAIATEAWAIITGEFETKHGDGRGVSISTLRKDLDKLNA
jgi:hypothetical protein